MNLKVPITVFPETVLSLILTLTLVPIGKKISTLEPNFIIPIHLRHSHFH